MDKYLALRRDAKYLSNSFLTKARLLKCGLHLASTNKKVDFKSDLIAFWQQLHRPLTEKVTNH